MNRWSAQASPQPIPRGRPTRWVLGGTLALAAICVALAAAACGSVGPKAGMGGTAGTGADGSGGATDTDARVDAPLGTGGAARGSGGSGTGGSATVDASVDQARADAPGDAPGDTAADATVIPVSCQQIKQDTPAAASGVFTIAPLGVAQRVFCEMTVDNGGWTAFYVGDNGTPPGGAHFENAADSCPDPANQCIRRLPTNVDVTRDFAVKCGASVVKFKLAALSLDYLKNGLQHDWQPLTGATTIDVGVVGKANLVGFLWTGGVNNLGWIVAGDKNVVTSAFADGYTTNAAWNYCNGSTQIDTSSRVMLFYR